MRTQTGARFIYPKYYNWLLPPIGQFLHIPKPCKILDELLFSCYTPFITNATFFLGYCADNLQKAAEKHIDSGNFGGIVERNVIKK